MVNLRHSVLLIVGADESNTQKLCCCVCDSGLEPFVSS